MQVAEAVRYRRKVAGSIPGGVIGIFHSLTSSGLRMVDSACSRNE